MGRRPRLRRTESTLDGSSNSISIDFIRKPGLTQQSSGGNGCSWNYGLGPCWLDGTIARHFRDYKMECQNCRAKIQHGQIHTSWIIRRPWKFASFISQTSMQNGCVEWCKTHFGWPSCCSNAMSTTLTPSLLIARYLRPQRSKHFVLS